MRSVSTISIVLLCLWLFLDILLIIQPTIGSRVFTKTLLIPLLTTYLLCQVKWNKVLQPVLLALIFSWVGDVLLLKTGYLLYGLLAFLAAHIFYIAFFLKLSTHTGKKGMIQRYPHTLIPIVVYSIVFISIILPRKNEVPAWAILLYGAIICTAWVMSVNLFNKVAIKSAIFLCMGMTVFVISDSFLAYTVFVKPTVWMHVLVMLTYLLAQWLLVKGAIQAQCPNQVPLSS